MEAWAGQYCINVTDLDRTVAFYETLGLTNTSRTEIPDAFEAIMEDAGLKGGKIQLAQQKEQTGPIDHGNAIWKLYVNTNDIEGQYQAAIDGGYQSESPPVRMEQWPVTVGFLRDPDGYLVELVQRHPWTDGDDRTFAWVGQYCIYVSDMAQTIKFYETLGLTCTSQTDIPKVKEAILENGNGKGGKIQLAQKLEGPAPIDMGTAMWKLYLHTDDCEGLHQAALDAGYGEMMQPMKLERWNTTISFVLDPDGYQVELVQRHPD
ncbi:MAG: VOC family protein [Acidimicrobiia bacterium]|nr:VOC family protein [Acidimicrobiia bacterium]MDH5238563.1 VOC family protein [Acidimicrobiia bacterium]